MPRAGQLADDVELLRPELPTEAEWTAALNRAGELFGATAGGRSLGARNVAALADDVKVRLAKVGDAAELPAALEPKLRDWANPDDAPRLATARASAALLAQLGRSDGTALVRVLASFTPTTSLAAMERNFGSAAAAKVLLDDDARWIVLRQVQSLLGTERGERARLLLQDLAALLTADEVNKMLADGLADLTRRADTLLRLPTERRPPDPPEPPEEEPAEQLVLESTCELPDATSAVGALRALAARLEAEGQDASRVTIRVTAWKPRPA